MISKVTRLGVVASCGWGVLDGRPTGTRFGSAGICCRRTVHQRYVGIRIASFLIRLLNFEIRMCGS